ncbi:hypothetical protein T4D_16522 [Trichinella pseudospiralis]|uniref:Uncharacterized protein n=1 Tax=Trichinella pseudospiralis TaxID=6337 RepID=A0A0V1FXM6_TRIPS|nr:hypothetical protein T4D_16522 [Trichinella pseudospiralis]
MEPRSSAVLQFRKRVLSFAAAALKLDKPLDQVKKIRSNGIVVLFEHGQTVSEKAENFNSHCHRNDIDLDSQYLYLDWMSEVHKTV